MGGIDFAQDSNQSKAIESLDTGRSGRLPHDGDVKFFINSGFSRRKTMRRVMHSSCLKWIRKYVDASRKPN